MCFQNFDVVARQILPDFFPPLFKHSQDYGGENLKSLGCQVDVLTNDNGIRKVRYVDSRSNQLVMRVDEHDYCDRIHLDDLKYVSDWANDYDAVVISDYCKGFLNEEDIKYIIENSNNVFIDTKKQLGDWIRGVDFIKINELEHKKNFETLPNYPELEDKLIVTQGSKGCVYMGETFPVEEVSVKDVSGAGDTFLSGLVTQYIKTQDMRKAIKFAQECTTKVVQQTGVTIV